MSTAVIRLLGALVVCLLATAGTARTITYEFDLQLRAITYDWIERAIVPDDPRYGYGPPIIYDYDVTGDRYGEIRGGQRLRATFDDITGNLDMLERCIGGFTDCRDLGRYDYIAGDVDLFHISSLYGCCVGRYNFTDGPWGFFSPQGMSYTYTSDDRQYTSDHTGHYLYSGPTYEWDIINLARWDDAAPLEEPPHMPLPGGLPLMVAGIAGLGLLRKRAQAIQANAAGKRPG
ncbi:VPLPA-CTERM sorting domain-containing protein [Poseidonocella sedimentorum]|nr:VPLPA-CTERM sorting domain-containing protein [Poseidonocella sedimentorum]